MFHGFYYVVSYSLKYSSSRLSVVVEIQNVISRPIFVISKNGFQFLTSLVFFSFNNTRKKLEIISVDMLTLNFVPAVSVSDFYRFRLCRISILYISPVKQREL